MSNELNLIALYDNKIDKSEDMTKDDTAFFINLLIFEKQNSRSDDIKHHLKDAPIAQIIKSRLSLYKDGDSYNIVTPYTLAWVEHLSAGIPGRAVMWAHTLKELHKKKNEPVTVNDIALSFPIGFPSDIGYSSAWDLQKGRTQKVEVDNLLDTKMAWK